MQRFDFYLRDIILAINKIEKSLKGKDKEEFKKNDDLIDMTLMRIQIIGESIKKIPEKIKNKYKEINWKKASLMRNIISHEYFKVDLDIVWSLIKKEIPKIKKVVGGILEKENDNKK